MKKWMFLLAVSVFLIGFQAEKAHAEQDCQEWVYDSNNNVVPGSEQCVPAVPQPTVNHWTSASGQDCEQKMNPDGSPALPATCVWPTKTESAGPGCSIQVYTAGPKTGETLGQPWCPGLASAPTEHLKTWVEP